MKYFGPPLAQAQKDSEKRLMDSQGALAQAQKDTEKRLMDSQKDTEKRLIDRMNLNNFKVAGLTIGGAAALGTFLLFILQNAGFKVLNPYLPLESKP